MFARLPSTAAFAVCCVWCFVLCVFVCCVFIYVFFIYYGFVCLGRVGALTKNETSPDPGTPSHFGSNFVSACLAAWFIVRSIVAAMSSQKRKAALASPAGGEGDADLRKWVRRVRFPDLDRPAPSAEPVLPPAPVPVRLAKKVKMEPVLCETLALYFPRSCYLN